MGRSPHIRLALVAASLALLALSAPAAAQVVVNEILANPVGTDTGTERVEIYNAGPGSVDMTGWAIDDAVTIGQTAVRARIPEDLDPACSTNPVIGPGEFRTVMMQGGAAVLNNTGDDVYLVSNRLLNATVVHSVTYPQTVGEGQGWACIPNGSANYAWRSLTLCASNGGTGDVVAPAAIADLLASPGAFPGEIRLTWTAPGDDGNTGTASSYTIRVSHDPITAGTFDAVADLDRWIGEPVPFVAGTPETLVIFGLDPDSLWYFAIQTQDEVPNTSPVSNTSGTASQAGALLDPNLGFTPFYGNLHSHTSYSDGVQTPAQAYSYARNGAPTPLDFLAVTEHNHTGAGMSHGNYALGMAEAASANADGDFVAIWGQEWGIIATGGHANVFESPELFGWEAGQYDVFVAEGDYTGLYTAVRNNPPANGHPPLVEWCHPSSGDFNSYAVTADGQAVVSLMALITGPAFSTSTNESDVGSTTGNEALFQDALRKGYRVSPTGDQDNHNATWGASTETRTVALASGKTKSQILTALSQRRCYASQDHNVQVQFSAEGRPMGAAWTAAQGIRFAARVIDPDPTDGVAQIDLLRGITGSSNATVVATSLGSSSFAWRERQSFAPGTEAHYYLRIRMNDNANIWTGPVYVTYDPNSVVAVGDGVPSPGLRMAASPNPAYHQVTASFALPRDVRQAGLTVYDANGRHVKTLLDGPLTAGVHQIAWTGTDDFGRPSPAGIFFMRLEAGEQSAVRKVVLMR